MPDTPRAALLWDESGLWGVMALHALRQAGCPVSVVTADEVSSGALSDVSLLFVPGGWASLKTKRLGSAGADAVRNFVQRGGMYFGICGGAGLALDVPGGLGLLPVARRPTRERVPSFSGSIEVHPTDAGHPLWYDPAVPVVDSTGEDHRPVYFPAWWPSQFSIVDAGAVDVLARYGSAGPDAMSSDMAVSDVDRIPGLWAELEGEYGILLDPARLRNEPAVVEGMRGRGRVILSLLHFDTPGDRGGRRVLRNLWRLAGITPGNLSSRPDTGEEAVAGDHPLYRTAREIFDTGIRLFLWRPRGSWLSNWRRGIRGLEYTTLYVLSREIARLNPGRDDRMDRTAELLLVFAAQARELLLRERTLLDRGRLSFRNCPDSRVAAMRAELFGTMKSHGGRFKEVLDRLDALYLDLLRQGAGAGTTVLQRKGGGKPTETR